MKKPVYQTKIAQAIIKKLKECKVGEGIFVTQQEWTLSSNFASYIYYLMRKARFPNKFIVRTSKDGTGWAVLRVK